MNRPQLVYVFVFNRIADWEIGLATAHLNAHEGQFLPSRYRVRTVGVDRSPIVTMGGFRVTPDSTLDEIDARDAALLILPGGLGWDQGQHTAAIAAAHKLLSAGVSVAAICGATAALARAGVLDQRRHTSNAKEYLLATGYAGSSLYADEAAVCDNGVITAGASHALEFATEIFRKLELYSPDAIDAWYGLFKTGEARYFGTLMAARHAAGVTG